MMQRRPGTNLRPTFPAELLELSEDEFVDMMRAGKYAEDTIEKELVLFKKLHGMYRPALRKSVESVPVNDEEDAAYKALRRSQEKQDEQQSTNKQQKP